MHTTTTGEKRKALKKEALELARVAKAARRRQRFCLGPRRPRIWKAQANKLKAEAEA